MIAVVILLQVIAVVAETSYQTLEIFLIFQSIEGLTSFNKDNRANLSGEKEKRKTMMHCGRRFFENTRKILKSNFVLVVVLVFESKGPYYHLGQKMQRKY